jgi:hypothetical protein
MLSTVDAADIPGHIHPDDRPPTTNGQVSTYSAMPWHGGEPAASACS